MVEDPFILTERPERMAQLDPKIDCLGERVTIFRQVIQGVEGLFQVGRGFPIGGAGEGLGPSLSEVRDGPAPRLTPEGVVSELFDVLCQPFGMEPLDGFYDLAIESAPPVVEEAPVGHVMGQGVLEGVLEVREEPRLVEELGGLEGGEAAAERFLRFLDDGLEEGEGHVLADDG
ncbi:MAG TPA: hypothetical protein VLD61_01500, partial [Methylomirabilota bacterium]|nr:hypothetical protein [Methylomirabilota bacterium]